VSNRQLILVIGAVTILALTLAWIIERTQIQRFREEFDEWWTERNGGKPPVAE
jgi:hypothetical protein